MYSFAATGVALFASCYAAAWYSGCYLLPASVSFGELQTFRELAMVVANDEWAESDAEAVRREL